MRQGPKTWVLGMIPLNTYRGVPPKPQGYPKQNGVPEKNNKTRGAMLCGQSINEETWRMKDSPPQRGNKQDEKCCLDERKR
ncbi:unnamed protein product [Timema podura]|uniref:Uncharacterized protein n=1 Tax=Timema podura TaxID=61482 RepID=A0ABN7NS80_TIMPD|nr:unnamed protein product [Timema podura]